MKDMKNCYTSFVNKPNLYFERKLWKMGFKIVAGCDEVGRGCFAGPVVAGVCVFSHKFNFKGQAFKGVKIDDSKKMTALQRERADEWIRKNCLGWGVGLGSVAEINKKGLSKATYSAFRRAIISLYNKFNIRVDYMLIDAFYVPYVRGLSMPCKTEKMKNRRTRKLEDYKYSGKQLALVHGDEKVFSVAAASIIAKVYRDKLMQKLAENKKYGLYKWDKNKGYGTGEHTDAIIRYGLTCHHRKSFIKTYIMHKG